MRSASSALRSSFVTSFLGVFAMADPIDELYTKFMIARAKAVEEYGKIEQSLCLLVAALLQIDPGYAGILFFRINNARSRNEAVQALVRKRDGTKFNRFLNPLFKMLNATDQVRNQIVHWSIAHSVSWSPTGGQLHDWHLMPPNVWDRKSETPIISTQHLDEFADKCDVLSRSINMFTVAIDDKLPIPPDVRATWLDICQQELDYPLPDTHPLSRNYVKP